MDENEVQVQVLDEAEVKERIVADLKDRMTFIGGSDAPIILGLAAYKSRYELWQEKVGEKEPDDLANIERVQWGIVLEDTVAMMYARRTGKKIRRINERMRDKRHPWRACQIDRRIVGGGILEIKTTDGVLAAEWGEEGTADIPPKYYAQVQHQLAVKGDAFAEVAVLIGGNKMKLYIVPRDDEFIADLTVAEEAFWNLVTSRTPPEPITPEEASMMWRKAPSKPVAGTTVHGAIAAELQAVKDQIKELEARADDFQLQLQQVITDKGDTLMIEGTPVASWKSQTRNGVDLDRLKAEYPVVAEACKKTTEYRTFRLLKGAGNFKANW